MYTFIDTQLNSKNIGPGGIPFDEYANSDDETDFQRGHLPGARRGDDGSRTSKVEVLTHQVSFCNTGREWAAVSGEGWLQIYSLEDDLVFDPIALTEEITPAEVGRKLSQAKYGLALRTALALNEVALIRQVLDETPFGSIAAVAKQVNPEYLSSLLSALATQVSSSPHIEFYLEWTLQLLQTHGVTIERQYRSRLLRALRSLYKEISKQYDDLKIAGNSNRYILAVLHAHGELMAKLETGENQAMITDQ
jgi:periodic tryptophan protein 2